MNCVQTNIVTSRNPAWTNLNFCYAQNILYCNFDHNCSDSFYLSLFFFFSPKCGLRVFMVVM